jgi:hypothetical protein
VAYTKQTWQDHSTRHPASAARFGYIETGVEGAHQLVDGHTANGAVHVTAGEKAALAGTAGTPSGSNKYVTNDDSRLSAVPLNVNVKDYGAVGDGVTDDRAAIQAAIDDRRVRGIAGHPRRATESALRCRG